MLFQMAHCSPVSDRLFPTALESQSLSLRRYCPALKAEWDAFIGGARNATFLFQRDYMDYHAERFLDHSLMLYEEGRLAAVLPANMDAEGVLASHDGLTYGGLVVAPTITLRQTITCFQRVLMELHAAGVATLRYKRFPAYYSSGPEDDLGYCLFLLDARLYRRDCTLAVPLDYRLPVQKRRARQAKKAVQAGLAIREDAEFSDFWQKVLTPRLAERYGVRPVHSLAEMQLLASRFPKNIKQFSVFDGDEVLAGITIYETPDVAHAQYIASTERGRNLGALDFLVGWLLNERYDRKRHFDFGGSNEQQGRALNHGLVEWKEGFGARSFALDYYQISTANYGQLEKVLASE